MAQLGDIAIVGFDADAVNNVKTFAYVVLADLSGQTISFTDDGWYAAGGFRSGEGVVTSTVPTGTAIGTVITVTVASTATFNPSTSGDQITAFAGTLASPTNLFSVDFADNNSSYAGDATSSNTSAVPAGLTLGQSALAFPLDNGAYSGPLSGTRSEILANIANANNWTLKDDAPLPSYPGSFTIVSGTSPGSFSIADAAHAEGDTGTTAFAFTVSRAGGSSGAADLTYSVGLSGTADAADFTGGAPAGGTVHFADGQTSATITLGVAGDTLYESNETFAVTLTGASAGTIGTASATGTITNDDPVPAGSLSIAPASVNEGDSGATAMLFTVTRTGGSVGAITADYAVTFNGTANAADLTGATSGTVSFADGETSKQITIQVAGDTGYEPNETFGLVLSNPTGSATLGTGSATGTIVNDDAPPPPAPLFINEIHYDNIGTDTGEKIEIAGPAGTDLTGWTLLLYNGNGGAVYSTTSLSGTIADQSNGYGTTVVSYGQDGIQNGSPDGVALVAPNGQVVQFLSYEGTMTATNGAAAGMASTDIGVVEESGPLGYSLQLTGTGANYSDFNWTSQPVANTFGAINTGESFLPAAGPGYVGINDASVSEGDSGTKALTFTVTRSGGSAASATVDYALHLTGSADQADLAANTPLSGTVSFGVGETVKTISIGVVGDTAPEPNETFQVQLFNPTNGGGYTTYISDTTGVGTIVNNDPIPLNIYQIQGAGLTSAYVGQQVTTTGVVTAVGNGGFYIQDPTGDGDATTSDAIFVATSSKAAVAVGDAVSVGGIVAEAGGSGALTLTQFAVGATVTVASHGNALPAAVLIGHDGLHPPTEVIDNDHLQSFDPTTDGIDFYETLEGMRVTIDAPQVVARTDSNETWVVASHGEDATGINAAGGITVSAGDFNPEKILLDPQSDVDASFSGTFTVGDQLADVTGILTYGTASANDVGYKVIPTSAATLTYDANLQPEVTAITGDTTHLTIASFNMENADVSDGAQKFQLIANTVVYNLKAPDIIFAQEIQDADGAGAGTDYTGTVTANAVIAAVDALGGPHYTYVEVAPTTNNDTGGEPNGNIRPGYFYNADRVSYVEGSASQITGPAFNGSRRPLTADFTFNGQTITTVDVHSTSRLGSDSLFGSYQPPLDGGDAARTAQAQAIATYVTNVLASDPEHNIVVGGDFNGFYFEPALTALETNGLTNLNSLLPVEERYSYLFDGNSEQIDNLLASQSLLEGAQFDAVHINTLKAATAPMATDHDQVITSLYIRLTQTGTSGNDLLRGGDNDDELRGLDGNDTLYGGNGNDVLKGGAGADKLYGDGGQDAIYGGDGAGKLYGGAGGDTLIGGLSGDTLDGGTGADTMQGRGGNDTYIVDDAGDVVDETDGMGNAAGGTDTVRASIASYTLSAFVDNLTYTGAGAFSGTGNDLKNSITGGDGDDTLSGLGGNDTLTGGIGADHLFGGDGNDAIDGGIGGDDMHGGAGNDTYHIDDVGDVVDETDGMGNDAGGTDTVRADIASVTLGAYIENLTYLGTGAFTGIGNDLANTITGGDGGNTLYGLAGNDKLTGGDGNDTLYGGADNDTLSGGLGTDHLYGGDGMDALNGGAGADVMEGGAGNDTYTVDDSADQVIEFAGGGTDVVKASASFTLVGEIETLTFTGTGDYTGTGSDTANTITGGAGDDTLLGMGGADKLSGGLGNDHLDGGDGADTLTGGAGVDSFTGGANADRFIFASLTDVSAGPETITDFSHAQADLIDLSGIDANSNSAGNQAFAFIGAGGFTGTAGQLHYVVDGDTWHVEGDVNGDRVADFTIDLTHMTAAPALIAADFHL